MNRLKALAELVYSARIHEGWTQGQLAAKADLGLSTIQKIEQGREPEPRLLTMQKIAIAFGMSYDAKDIAFIESSPPERDSDIRVNLPATRIERERKQRGVG